MPAAYGEAAAAASASGLPATLLAAPLLRRLLAARSLS
jgi:hypothetical protein